MVGQHVRKGGAVLAALAIFSGGAVMGAAGAGAASTGSAGPGGPDPTCGRQCDDAFHGYGLRGDIAVYYEGPVEAVVGREVTYKAEFSAYGGDPWTGLPDVDVATVTHHAPEGFTFTGAQVTSYDWTPGRYPVTVLDSAAVVDPATGDVAVAAPAGGWAIPVVEDHRSPDKTYYASGIVTVTLRYTATQAVRDGVSGLTFTGTGAPASEGWVAKGSTQVAEAPKGLGGFGSSES
ncbi:hypothetical protein [Rhodococcus sp. NPDC127528]|uniref:hypothetical protein n=1 Tax=unclassified Rhodococcus (in: high G+C Gram-positive bacteria) TaxID=192944 RepID=UPI003639F082